jgi:replicative DNA helicase
MIRLLSAESDINLHYLQTGKMDEAQKLTLHRHGVNELAKMKIFFDDAPGLSIMHLRAKARRLKRKHNIGLIIIDYLQLMTGQGNTREQEISGNTRQLKTLAQELEIPIIALSQLSRDVEKRTGAKRIPQLSDLRESGAIEQDADDVLFLYGPDQEDIDKDASLLGARKLRVAKARNGLLATIDLEFNGSTQFFKERTATGFRPVNTELF